MIGINNNKAIEIAKDKIRVWRKDEFTKNDLAIQNALADGNEEERIAAVERRDYLRSLPDIADNKNIEELSEILKEY